MANLQPLIRYRSFQVDEKRRVIAALYEEASRLEQQKMTILDVMMRETKVAKESGSFDTLRMLGTYVAGAKKRIAMIDESVRRLDLRIQLAQDDLREAFTDLKKIEILHGRRLEREREASARREEEVMNEIGLTLFRRQGENEGDQYV